MASINICFLYAALALFLLLGVSQASATRLLEDQPMRKMHEQWMTRYGRVYKDAKEKEARFEIFKKNVERINTFNNASNRSYKQGVNQFTDMSSDELSAFGKSQSWVQTKKIGRRRSISKLASNSSFIYKNATYDSIPSSVDWRERGAVTPIIDDGINCASCWAFAAATAVEAIHQIATGELIPLSAQQLVDCDPRSQGCAEGNADNAFEFIAENGGIASLENYPFVGEVGTCIKGVPSAANITWFETSPIFDEIALVNTVAYLPVVVQVDASGIDFIGYSGGVFDGPCGNNNNHFMTVVGYGTETDGTKYWIAKNCWGPTWGEGGYIRMKRDVGLCGIGNGMSYPIICDT